jgi:hypothetical protein
MMTKKAAPSAKEFWPKGIAKPAQRALAAAGYTNVGQLANAREADLAALHGLGDRAIGILCEALKQRGKTFRK